MDNISEFIKNVSEEKTQENPNVSRVIQAKLKNILCDLIKNCTEITSAMISSSDGMAWAQETRDDFDQNRFAAMSSTLLALSDAMMNEAQNSKTRNVFLEGDAGMVFVMHASNDLLLTIFTSSTQQIGMPLAHAKKVAEDISQLNLNGMATPSD